MKYKEVTCPECNGRGVIFGGDENSMWSKTCDNCHGEGIIAMLMTNGDIIRACNNEQLIKVYYNLEHYAIYSSDDNKRLLFKDNAEDFLLWMNKVADKVDIDTIFSFLDKRDYVSPFFKTKS